MTEVVMGDTQNFIHDKYREKISRKNIAILDISRYLFVDVHIFYNAQKGRGVDNLLYALYVVVATLLHFCYGNAKNIVKKWPFLRYIMWKAPNCLMSLCKYG